MGVWDNVWNLLSGRTEWKIQENLSRMDRNQAKLDSMINEYDVYEKRLQTGVNKLIALHPKLTQVTQDTVSLGDQLIAAEEKFNETIVTQGLVGVKPVDVHDRYEPPEIPDLLETTIIHEYTYNYPPPPGETGVPTPPSMPQILYLQDRGGSSNGSGMGDTMMMLMMMIFMMSGFQQKVGMNDSERRYPRGYY